MNLPHSSPYYAFPTRVLVEPSERFPRRDEPSMVELNDGSCLLAYANHEGNSDNDTSDIAGRIITSDGEPTDEEWILVHAPEGGMNAMSPAIRRLSDGRLGMVYSYRISVKEARREFRSSSDEGRTWSEATVVGAGEYKTGRHDSLTVLDDTRLLAPLHCTDDWDSHYLHVRVAKSDDNGGHWALGDPIELPHVGWPDDLAYAGMESGCIEPFAAQRADGTVLMTLRTGMGTQFFSESSDRGTTWSEPRSMEVISPVAPANLTRLPGSEDLLLVWTTDYDAKHSNSGPRHTITACISSDGGRSWPHARRKVLVYDTSQSNDYPLVMYKGNEAWVVIRHSSEAHFLRGRVATILMKVPVSWFYE